MHFNILPNKTQLKNKVFFTRWQQHVSITYAELRSTVWVVNAYEKIAVNEKLVS